MKKFAINVGIVLGTIIILAMIKTGVINLNLSSFSQTKAAAQEPAVQPTNVPSPEKDFVVKRNEDGTLSIGNVKIRERKAKIASVPCDLLNSTMGKKIEEFNKNCPQLKGEMRVDKMSFSCPKVHYYYSLMTVDRDLVTAEFQMTVKTQTRENLARSMKSQENFVFFLNKGVEYHYLYRDKYKRPFVHIVIDKSILK